MLSNVLSELARARAVCRHVPTDFPQTALEVHQTSSVPEFNELFSDMEGEVQRDADMCGIRPKWPQLIRTFHQLGAHVQSGRASEHVVFDQDVNCLVRNMPGLVQGIAFHVIKF